MIDRLGWQTRRAMGLTFRNIRAILADMKRAREVQGKSAENLAIEVLNKLVEQNPNAYSGAAGLDIDWDALFEFLVKVIDLILRLFF